MRIGFYGGTFDPIHHGHLILAREAAEQLGLDRIMFIPNRISPHKLVTTPVPPEVRVEMVRAAIEGEELFTLDELELERSGPSFTIDTMLEMRGKFPHDELIYFIGEDNVAELHTWRRIKELQALVQFAVFERSDHQHTHGFLRITRRVDISATDIRMRVATGRSIRYLVPERVREIITGRNLYKEPPN